MLEFTGYSAGSLDSALAAFSSRRNMTAASHSAMRSPLSLLLSGIASSGVAKALRVMISATVSHVSAAANNSLMPTPGALAVWAFGVVFIRFDFRGVA